MSEREQFLQQADDIVRALGDAIEHLQIAQERKTELSGLAQSLREFAYRAGRAEASEIVAALIESQACGD